MIGQTKWVYSVTEDDNLLEKFNTIWDKVSADIKKIFDCEPVYNRNFLKTKKKSRGNKVPDFYTIKKLKMRGVLINCVPTSNKLCPPPPSSFWPLLISLKQPQNIARNWAIAPDLGPKNSKFACFDWKLTQMVCCKCRFQIRP